MHIPDYMTTANMIFFSFRMPLFFILSGLFITSSLRKRSVNNLILNRFDSLIYPYLVWSIIQVTLQIVFSGEPTNAARNWKDYLYILYQPRALDQFWYLPALFNTTLIFILLKTKAHLTSTFQIALGLLLYFVSPFFEKVSLLSDWMSFYIFFAIGDAVSIAFFKPKVQKFLRSPWLSLMLLPVFVISQLYYLNNVINEFEFLLIALTGCIYMFVLAFKLESLGIFKFLKILGYHSIYIYVMHVILTACSRIVLTKFLGIEQPLILLTIGILVGTFVPVVIYKIIGKNRFGMLLFSFRKSKN